MSLPVTRPTGRALVVGAPSNRSGPAETLARLYAYQFDHADDPYAAMLALSRRPFAYQALVLSLASTYRAELAIITTVKRRFGNVEIWLAHTDGRQALLAEAMRLGADGLLADDGLHRLAPAPEQPAARRADSPGKTDLPPPRATDESTPADAADPVPGEPVLTPDELRALLQDQPSMPPSGAAEQS